MLTAAAFAAALSELRLKLSGFTNQDNSPLVLRISA
ncbi:hypothetical protein BH10CHL1_BH10CHL1_10880 [soil metagenome]